MSGKVFPLLLLAGSAATLIATMQRANAALPADTTIDGVSLQAWSNDVDTLARTAWAENRSGGWLGMQSVCNVVMNRAAMAAANGGYWWGNNVRDICTRRSGNVYQFDCWRPGSKNNAAMMAVTTADQEFRDALELATRAVAGNLADITRGATHYYAPGDMAEPYWARGQTVLADIQGQLFYQVA